MRAPLVVLTSGYCRIKYIGRNCRVVLVGGVLLKAEQEVTALPGTKVILNFNNKVNDLPPLVVHYMFMDILQTRGTRNSFRTKNHERSQV